MGGSILSLTGQPPSEFRIGDIFGRAFEVLFQHFGVFVVITGCAMLPSALLNYAIITDPTRAPLYLGLVVVLQNFLTALCEAMVLHGAFQHLRGLPVTAGETVSRGMARFVPVVVTSFLVTLITTAGLFCCVVPGVIAMATLVAALPACVVERLGPIKSISRSYHLTEGSRGQIFLAFLMFGLVTMVVSVVVQGMFSRLGSTVAYVISTYAWGTLQTSYLAVLVAIVYHDLRVVNEGLDVEQIAALFD